MDREAWCAAFHGSQRVGHDWVTELNFWFHFWLIGWFRIVLFNFHIFVNSSNFFLLLISDFLLLRPERLLDTISIFWNLLTFVLWPNISAILENVHVHLRWMHIVLLGNVCKCLLGPLVSRTVQCFPIDFLSGWSIHYWTLYTEAPYYYCTAVDYSLQICLYLLT